MQKFDINAHANKILCAIKLLRSIIHAHYYVINT